MSELLILKLVRTFGLVLSLDYFQLVFVNPCLHYLDLVEFELFDALSSRILGWFGAWINFFVNTCFHCFELFVVMH